MTLRDSFNTALRVARRMLRQRRWLALSLLLAVTAGIAVPRLLPPLYVSETVVLYRERISRESLLGSQGPAAESRRARNARLRELALARSSLQSVISAENLYPETVRTRGLQEAIDDMREDVIVRVSEGDTVLLSFRGTRPDVVQRATQRMADNLIAQMSRYDEESAESTRAFLAEQEAQAASELRDKEQAVAEFLALHPEFALDTAPQATAGASIRAAVAKVDVTAKADSAGPDPRAALARQATRLRARLHQSGQRPAVPAASGEETRSLSAESRRAIAEAEAELHRAQEALSSAQARFTSLHPDVMAAQRRVSAATDRVNGARLAATYEAAPAAPPASPPPAAPPERAKEDAARELAVVEAELARVRKGVTQGEPLEPLAQTSHGEAIVALETRWAALSRELETIRERHGQLVRRLFQASTVAQLEGSGENASMVVIDPAYLPVRPSTRGRVRTGLLAAFGAACLLGLVALIRALLDDHIYEEEDLRSAGLGSVRHLLPKLEERGVEP